MYSSTNGPNSAVVTNITGNGTDWVISCRACWFMLVWGPPKNMVMNAEIITVSSQPPGSISHLSHG